MNKSNNQRDILFHRIIDEIHPLYKAISDEELIEDCIDHGRFVRNFLHKESGKSFRMIWKVYYGTPETVKTVFEAPVQI
jgi:hypothetical protein